MLFTKRPCNPIARHALAAAYCLAGVAVAASCSGGAAELTPSGVPMDASPALPHGDTGINGPNLREAGTLDAGPLPITCTSGPCARALVTTLGADVEDRSEGFCALLDDGTVACWGANGAGQLGRGEGAGDVDSSKAARVLGLSGVVMLDHTCAIDESGGVLCWGTGPFLRTDARLVTTERAPVKLDLPPATTVGASYATACVAVSEGVLCWGSNTDAQLGPIMPTSGDDSKPRLLKVPSGAPVRTLAVGRAVFVLRTDGTLVTWGGNPPIGRLSAIFPDPYPLSVDLRAVATADLVYDNACASAGGTGYCWGVPLPSSTQGPTSPVDRALPEPVVTPEPIVQIATTRTHVIDGIGLQRYRWCAVGAVGAAYCWGLNESGQAGDGTLNYAFDAVKVRDLPEPVAQVKTTPNTTCAVLTNGRVYCWGSNYNGQLGNGSNRGRALAPVEVVLP